MPSINSFDIIVIGSGCTGLSFLEALNQLDQTKRILVLEQATSLSEIPKKTWSFWTQNPNHFQHILWHEWQSWYISTKNQSSLLNSQKLTYQSIHSEKYLNHCLNNLSTNPNVTFLFNQSITGVTYPTHTSCQVHSDTDCWDAHWVIDTRPPMMKRDFELIQSFRGAYIKTNTPLFNPTQFGLMDQIKTIQKTIQFTYLLPKNPYTCLIESTVLHQPNATIDLDGLLEHDLKRICDNHNFSIIREELGHLPMTSHTFKQPSHKRHIHAGQSAGALRPSSGYGFIRILKWAQYAAQAYHLKNYIPKPNYHRGIMYQMDKIFLNVLKQRPEVAPTLFLSLADKLSGDEFAMFMMDQPNINIWLKIMHALPTRTMMNGLLKKSIYHGV